MADASSNWYNPLTWFSGNRDERPKAPGEAQGVLSWFRRAFTGWPGNEVAPGTGADRELRTERVRSGPSGIVLPWFLPYFDDQQTLSENQAMRLAYRKMLADPNVKAAFLGKVLAVSSLDLKIVPADKKDPHANRIADFVRWNLTEALAGGVPNLIWSIISGALIDGYSISEKVWDLERRGEWEGHYYISNVKPKDTGRDVILMTDEFRNIVGVQGLRYNPGEMFHPSQFIIYRHLPLWDTATGVSDFRACYDDKTEILTKDGWKFFADLAADDEVATLDRTDGSDGTLTYHKPERTIRYHYKGRMFRQDSVHVDLCVTPDHRMWVAKRNGSNGRGDYQFVTANRLMDGSFPRIHHYKRDADWNGQEVETFVLPEIQWTFQSANGHGNYGERTVVVPAKKLPMDDWLRFLGFYLAEGSVYRRKTGTKQASILIHQNPGQKFDDIEAVVKRLGFAYCVQPGSEKKPCKAIRISNLQLYTYLKDLGKSHTKRIPAEYKQLSRRQLNILLDWMMRGDGRHNGTQYCTVSKRLADDVSEVILKCGFAPCTTVETNERRSIYIVSANTKGISATEVNRLNDRRSWEEYDGEVFCVTVPGNLVYVRRNGRSVWCGNCYSRWWLLDTVLKLRAIGLEKRSLPILLGTYQTAQQRPSLESTLADVKSQNWLAVPEGVRVEALNIAGSGDSQFADAVRDLKHDIFLGIQGAILQSLEGSVSDGRGSSQVHRTTADLFVWHLSQAIQQVLNDRNSGLIRDIVDINFVCDAYPKAVLGAIDVGELSAELDLDSKLIGMGLSLSKDEMYEKYGRKPPDPDNPEDELSQAKQQADAAKAQGGGAGGNPLAALMGGAGGGDGGGDGGDGQPGAPPEEPEQPDQPDAPDGPPEVEQEPEPDAPPEPNDDLTLFAEMSLHDRLQWIIDHNDLDPADIPALIGDLTDAGHEERVRLLRTFGEEFSQ